jgi:type VI protein secretion system component Hcp
MTKVSRVAGQQAGTNRRSLLMGAAGVAAGASVAGMGMGAKAQAAPGRPTLTCTVQNIGTFDAEYLVWSGGVQSSSGMRTTVEAATPTLASIKIGKEADATSIGLIAAMLRGTRLGQVTIAGTDGSGAAIQTVVLTDAFVSSFGTQTSEEGSTFEELELQYLRIAISRGGSTVTYTTATRETVGP